MEKNDPPAYTEQPLPSNQFTPAETYSGVPITQPPTQQLHPPQQVHPPQQEHPPQQVYPPQQVHPPQQVYPPQQGYPPPHAYPGGPTQPPLYPPYLQPPPQPQVNTAACVIINSTAQHAYIPVGRDPTFVRCPSCNNDVITSIQTVPDSRTHLTAMGLCLIGCWPCVCIPYCMDSCRSVNHTCPVCNAFIGTRR